jgi:hypothetical protein
MSLVAIALNVLLAALLAAALAMGWRLNRRLQTLRESQQGFAKAVAELNAAAARAEKGLADLRAAGDEAMDLLGDRIKKGREVAAKLETLIDGAPKSAPVAARDDVLELSEVQPRSAERDRLGALLAETQRRRAAAAVAPAPPARGERPLTLSRPRSFDDDLFEPPTERPALGALRSSR